MNFMQSCALIPTFSPPPTSLGRNQDDRLSMLMFDLMSSGDSKSEARFSDSNVKRHAVVNADKVKTSSSTQNNSSRTGGLSLFDGLLPLDKYAGSNGYDVAKSGDGVSVPLERNSSFTPSFSSTQFQTEQPTFNSSSNNNNFNQSNQFRTHRPMSADSVGSLESVLNYNLPTQSTRAPSPLVSHSNSTNNNNGKRNLSDLLGSTSYNQALSQAPRPSTSSASSSRPKTTNTTNNNTSSSKTSGSACRPTTTANTTKNNAQSNTISSQSGNVDVTRNNIFTPSDFLGIEQICRNGGASKQGLAALLKKVTTPPTTEGTESSVVLTCIYNDYNTSHSSITSKYCTPSTHCPNWLCAACDTHIRAVHATQRLIGVALLLPTEPEYVYFIPLVTCIEPQINEGPSQVDVVLPLNCNTTLEERWSTFRAILRAPSVRKVCFNSQLALIAIMSHLSNNSTNSDNNMNNTQHIDNSNNNNNNTNSFSVCASVTNISDPRIAAYMINSDTAEEHLELHSLFAQYGVQCVNTANNNNNNNGAIGSLTRVLYRSRDEMKSVFTLTQILENKLREYETYRVYKEIEMPITTLLSHMESQGVSCGGEYIHNISSVIRQKISDIQQEVSVMISQSSNTTSSTSLHSTSQSNFNMASPEQVSNILYGHFNLPPPSNNSKKNKHFSTSEEDLQKISHLHPIVECILNFRTLNKISNTYCESFKQFMHTTTITNTTPNTNYNNINNINNNSNSNNNNNNFNMYDVFNKHTTSTTRSIHANWNQTVVRTGRLSCSRPNLQNIPNKQTVGGIEINMREMIRAQEGFTFISADYSQIEMRLLAHLCGDPALTALFREVRGDIYKQLAGRILNRPTDAVTGEERNKAKVICLGVLYGMGPTATAAKLNIDVSAAQHITNSFFGCFRGMKALIASVKGQARKCGYIRTLLGRRRYLPDITSDDPQKSAQAERQAVNSVIQGTASDIIKYAMVHIDKQLAVYWKEMCVDSVQEIPVPRLVMQIHDELIFTVCSADPQVVERFVTLLHRAMNTDIMGLLRLSVPLLVNVQQGDSWGQFREYVATGR